MIGRRVGFMCHGDVSIRADKRVNSTHFGLWIKTCWINMTYFYYG